MVIECVFSLNLRIRRIVKQKEKEGKILEKKEEEVVQREERKEIKRNQGWLSSTAD